MACITYGDGLKPVPYSENGYLYACIVTVNGVQAYKVGFTKDPTARFIRCQPVNEVTYLVIQEQPDIFSDKSINALTRFERQAHTKLKYALNAQQVKSIQNLMFQRGFDGWTECYPYTDKTAQKISQVLNKVFDAMDDMDNLIHIKV